MLRSEESGHEKFKEGPQFKQVVFDRRTRQTDAQASLEFAYGTCRDRIGVFNILCFVKNDTDIFVFEQFVEIASKQCICSDDQLRAFDMLE